VFTKTTVRSAPADAPSAPAEGVAEGPAPAT
jgi:hypothetical protein